MKSSSAVVVLKGGAGNQLFQYALALMLRDTYQYKVVLESSYLTWRPSFGRYTKRKLSLQQLEIDIPVVRSKVFFLQYLVAQIVGAETWAGVVKTMVALMPKLTAGECQKMICDGYWQDLNIVNSVQRQLRRNFVLREQLSATGEKCLARIKASPNSVAVHVRRGDYATNKTIASQHILLDPQYFKRGLEFLKLLYSHFNVYVFSDDISWCKKELDLNDVYFCEHNPTERISPFEDMYIMSKCVHKIISNSTYSWWAAYLGDSHGQVVAPKQWLVSGDQMPLQIKVDSWHYL